MRTRTIIGPLALLAALGIALSGCVIIVDKDDDHDRVRTDIEVKTIGEYKKEKESRDAAAD